MTAGTYARRAVKPLGVITDVKKNGPLRIWVRGPQPTRSDAAGLMNLWDEGNRRVHEAPSPGGDRHVQPFEDMMQGFRQLGYEGAPPGVPDWYVPLADDRFDTDILRAIGEKVLVN